MPTFLFVDEAGDVLARVGYDTAKLRKEEEKGHPNAWLAFCDKVVKDTPPPQPLHGAEDADRGRRLLPQARHPAAAVHQPGH